MILGGLFPDHSSLEPMEGISRSRYSHVHFHPFEADTWLPWLRFTYIQCVVTYTYHGISDLGYERS